MDKYFMDLAFSEAANGLGSVKTNPCVGAVLVFEERIIGKGYHTAFGKPHAEIEAFNSVKSADARKIQHSTLYCTLEPCFHHGKTPPCVVRVLEEKIKHVVVAYIDPNVEVHGKSIALLRLEGVFVEILSETMPNIFDAAFRKTLLPFFTNQKFNRPYIILKWAQSKDGFISRRNERTAISNTFTRYEVHKWRSHVDAIMVGSNTVVIDNPALTNRSYFGNSPIRITFESAFHKVPQSTLFTDGKPTWVISSEGIKKNEIFYPFEAKKDFPEILTELYKNKIGTLLIEGGAELLKTFIKNNSCDEVRVITSSDYLFEGIAAPKINSNFILDRTENFTGDTIDYFFHTTGKS